MQVTETTNDGLRREFRVVVPATDLQTRVNERLAQMKDQVRINGFRPGKVPVAHLKKVYGRAVMAETIDLMVRETNSKIVTDHGLKLAMEPMTKRGLSVVEWALQAARATSAAALESSKARSAIPKSARTSLLAPKLSVSTQSAPTRRKVSWMDWMMSGRVRTRMSVQFSQPQ